MKALGMAILLALTSASFVMALGPWDSDTARGAGSLEAQGRAGGLMVRWEPPVTLPTDPLVGYQLRHRPQTTSQTPATWTTVDVGVVTSYRVTGLRDGTTYDVEVATRTAQGAGTFYGSTTGRPGASQCESGTAVADAVRNPGLMEDCETLLGLKAELAGTGTLSWSASTDMSRWRGVTVEGTPSRVIGIALRNRQLTGTIPPELGDLSELRSLALGNYHEPPVPFHLLRGRPVRLLLPSLLDREPPRNELTGAIPSELAKLTNLRFLDLSGNQLTGGIPEGLWQLSDFRFLDLSGNQLTGSIPAEVGQLSELESLDLSGNQLTGSIPEDLGQLGNLFVLYLVHNQLTGSIPEELGQLSNLLMLLLSDNQLTGSIPEELGKLSNLRVLLLSDNQLTGSIPEELGKLSNLLSLLLSDNQLTGSIPEELGKLSNLRVLLLSDNQLTGSIPVELGQLSNAVLVYLANNQLTGCVAINGLVLGGEPACTVVTITADAAQITEGTAAAFTVARAWDTHAHAGGTQTEPLTVSLSVSASGSMIVGELASSITIPANQASAVLTIATVDDAVGEPHSVVTAEIVEGAGYSRGSASAAQVIVTDDEWPIVTISSVTTPIDEGTTAMFRVVATGGLGAQTFDVPVAITETGATINAGASLPTSVRIPADRSPVDITVPTMDDTDSESDSVVTATLTSGTLYNAGPPAAASVAVRNDDSLVSFMAPDAITEGESAVFMFKRVGGLSHELGVSVSVLSTGDFVSGTAPSTVTFAAGSATADLRIPTDNDSVIEAAGSVAVLLRQGTAYDTTGTLLQQVPVRDNDRPTVTVRPVTSPIGEGGSAVFRVTATNSVITQTLQVPVTVTESGAMLDTSSPLPTTVTLTANLRSVDITVPTEDDTASESDSAITVTLSADTAYVLGDDSSAAVTVRDDDPVVSFAAPSALTEGESAVFWFGRVGGLSHELEVSVSVLPTGDFLSGTAPSTVTFAAGAAMADLSIPTVDDDTPEADGVIAVLLRQGTAYNTTGTLLQLVSVRDNDRSMVTIAAVASPVEEGNAAVFRVTRTGGTLTEPITVAVTVSENGKMISGTAPASVTIAANQTSADLSVPTHEDRVDEVNSIITAALTSGSTYDLGTAASAAVTVTDDDLPRLTITFDDTSPIEEGTTASFTVTRAGVTTEALTINLSVLETGNMIDVTPPTRLTFTAGSATVDLDIETEDDTVDEPDSTVFVGVTLPNSTRSRTPPDLISVVVTDND